MRDGIFTWVLRSVLLGCGMAVLLPRMVFAQAMRPSGDWPMYRHDSGLIGYQPLAGEMRDAPRVVAKYFLGASAGVSLPAELRSGYKGDVVVCARGQLFAYDADGKALWTGDTAGYDVGQVLWIDDLDGDGENEVIAQAGHVGGNQQAYVILDGATGIKRGAIDVLTGDFGSRAKCGSFLPGVKGKQILIVTSTKQGETGDTSFGEVALWGLGLHQGAKRLWSYLPGEFPLYYPHLMVGPVGPHGEMHAVIHSWCHVWNIDLANGKLVNHETWDPRASSPRQYGWSELIDADGDGKLDYVNVSMTKHVDMLRNVDGQLKLAWTHAWMDSYTTEQRALRPMCEPIVDLDGSGKKEVVAGLFDGLGDKRWHLYIWDAATGVQKSETMDVAPLVSALLDPKSKSRTIFCAHSTTVQFDPPTPLEAWRYDKGVMTKVWEQSGVRLVQDAATDTDRRVTMDNAMHTGFARMGDCDGDGRPEFFTKDLDGGAVRAWGLDDQGKIVEKKGAMPAAPESATTEPTAALPALAGMTVPYMLAADVYGDGHNELLLYDNSQVTIAKVDGGSVKVLEKVPSTEVPIVCDLLGDGKPVMLTAGRVESGDLYVAARGADKKEIWRYVFPQSAGCGQYSDRPHYFTVGHFTGKKNLDVFTYSMKPEARAYVLDGKTGQPVWRKGDIPNIERSFQAFGGRSCVFDYNGDGCDDLLFTNPDYYCVGDGRNGDLLVGPVNLQPLLNWWAAYSSPTVLRGESGPFVYLGGAYSCRAAISVDGKSKLFREYVPTERWQLLVDGQRFTEGLLPPSKINGHWRAGSLEADGTLRLLEADTGKALWAVPLGTAVSSIISGDVNGDGEPELLFGGRDGNLYCIGDGGTAAKVVWKMPLGAPIASVLMADLEGDGKSEIAASVGDGNVYILRE